MFREMFGQAYPVVISLGGAALLFVVLMLFIFKVLLSEKK